MGRPCLAALIAALLIKNVCEVCRKRKRVHLHLLAARSLVLKQDNIHLKATLQKRTDELAMLQDRLAGLNGKASGDSGTANAPVPALQKGVMRICMCG